MKNIKLALAIIVASLSISASTVHASDFFGSNNGEWKMGPNGPYWDESDWPEWTPMYWMEEFMDNWDNNNNWGGNNYGYGGNNYYAPNNGAPGYNPYGFSNSPYGYSMPYGNYMAPQVPSVPAIPTPK